MEGLSRTCRLSGINKDLSGMSDMSGIDSVMNGIGGCERIGGRSEWDWLWSEWNWWTIVDHECDYVKLTAPEWGLSVA